MTTVIVPNVMLADTDPDVPLRDGSTPFRFEMLFNGFVDRAYADNADELLACLIRGYDTMSNAQRLGARMHLAVRTQTTMQAELNYHYGFDACSPTEVDILQASRATPPAPTEWSSPVPLVLIDLYYEPLGDLPKPASTVNDVADPPNLVWLSPYDPYDFLVSLHEVGLVSVHEFIDHAA